ncbi:hypothetical protein L6D11_14060 [Staphylococcus aureus]|uniref:Rep family protein n=1 Tax=Staphylococcus borealis TaxID=2742203 RepID=UPI00374EA361|nr:hypothetical protein [Staphylococcus aureus]
MAKKNVDKRYTNFMYVQQEENLMLSIEDIKKNLDDEDHVKFYAIIRHDKDKNEENEYVKPHYHIFVHFNCQKSIKSVADLFEDKKNCVETYTKTKGSRDNGLMYLLHRTDKARAEGKFQYEEDELIFPDNEDKRQAVLKEYNRLIKKDKENFYSYKAVSKFIINEQLEKFASSLITRDELRDKLGIFEYSKHLKLIDSIEKSIVENLISEYKKNKIYENKKVIWIYGQSGVGKTRLSRKFAEEASNRGIYLTKSNRDPFENYISQDVVIIEDFRNDTGVAINELFQILDKSNPDFIAGSRYKGKQLIAHTYIINSILSPFDYIKHYDDEPIYQLLRRIDEFYELTEDKIYRQKLGYYESEKEILSEIVDQWGNKPKLSYNLENISEENNFLVSK